MCVSIDSVAETFDNSKKLKIKCSFIPHFSACKTTF